MTVKFSPIALDIYYALASGEGPEIHAPVETVISEVALATTSQVDSVRVRECILLLQISIEHPATNAVALTLKFAAAISKNNRVPLGIVSEPIVLSLVATPRITYKVGERMDWLRRGSILTMDAAEGGIKP